MRTRWLEGAAAALLLAATLGLLEAFRSFDFGRGVERFSLLAALGLVALVGPKVLPAVALPRARALAWSLLVLGVLFGVSAVRSGVASIERAHRTGDVRLDQGQIHLRAIRLLAHGENPYGAGTMLNPAQYFEEVTAPRNAPCLPVPAPQLLQALGAYWRAVDDPERAAALVPSFPPGCEDTSRRFRALSMAYGPASLLAYLPFVAAFGAAGIYVSHLFFLALLLAGLGAWTRHGETSRALSTAIALLVLFVPSHLRVTTLEQSCCDLAPVALALLGLVALERGRPVPAGLLIGTSIAAKWFPGLLLVPIVLSKARDPKTLACVVAPVLLLLLPLFVLDAEGVTLGLFLHNVLRDADSTALAFYVPHALRGALSLAGLVLIALLALRAHRAGFSRERTLEYVVASLLVLFATSKVFHNNYLVWLLPFLGLHLATVLAPRRASSTSLGSPSA